MKNSFDKQKEFSGDMKEDLERIRGELGKGIKLEEIAEKLNLEKEYVEFLFWFGIV